MRRVFLTSRMRGGSHASPRGQPVSAAIGGWEEEGKRTEAGSEESWKRKPCKKGKEGLGSGLLRKGLGVERKLVSSELSSWPSLVSALVSGSN